MTLRPAHLRIALFFIMIPMSASLAWAADAAPDPWAGGAASPGGETSMIGLLFRIAVSLAFIVLLIWGAVWVMRRFSDGGLRPSAGEGLVEVLGRTYIAPKKSVYVLRVGDRALAVGVTESTLTPLVELDLEETLSTCSESLAGRDMARLSSLFGGLKSRMTKDRT
jgi:flagellar biosynthetic protein FliO